MTTAERRQVDARETDSSLTSLTSITSSASSDADTPTTPPAGTREVITEGSYLTILPMNCVANIVKPEVVAAARCLERFEHSRTDADDGGEERERGPIKVSNEARQRFLDSATEFVMFITQEASDRCTAERRRIMNSNDILTAVEALGFGQQYAAVARRALVRLGEAQHPRAHTQGDHDDAHEQQEEPPPPSSSSSSKPEAQRAADSAARERGGCPPS